MKSSRHSNLDKKEYKIRIENPKQNSSTKGLTFDVCLSLVEGSVKGSLRGAEKSIKGTAELIKDIAVVSAAALAPPRGYELAFKVEINPLIYFGQKLKNTDAHIEAKARMKERVENLKKIAEFLADGIKIQSALTWAGTSFASREQVNALLTLKFYESAVRRMDDRLERLDNLMHKFQALQLQGQVEVASELLTTIFFPTVAGKLLKIANSSSAVANTVKFASKMDKITKINKRELTAPYPMQFSSGPRDAITKLNDFLDVERSLNKEEKIKIPKDNNNTSVSHSILLNTQLSNEISKIPTTVVEFDPALISNQSIQITPLPETKNNRPQYVDSVNPLSIESKSRVVFPAVNAGIPNNLFKKPDNVLDRVELKNVGGVAGGIGASIALGSGVTIEASTETLVISTNLFGMASGATGTGAAGAGGVAAGVAGAVVTGLVVGAVAALAYLGVKKLIDKSKEDEKKHFKKVAKYTGLDLIDAIAKWKYLQKSINDGEYSVEKLDIDGLINFYNKKAIKTGQRAQDAFDRGQKKLSDELTAKMSLYDFMAKDLIRLKPELQELHKEKLQFDLDQESCIARLIEYGKESTPLNTLLERLSAVVKDISKNKENQLLSAEKNGIIEIYQYRVGVNQIDYKDKSSVKKVIEHLNEVYEITGNEPQVEQAKISIEINQLCENGESEQAFALAEKYKETDKSFFGSRTYLNAIVNRYLHFLSQLNVAEAKKCLDTYLEESNRINPDNQEELHLFLKRMSDHHDEMHFSEPLTIIQNAETWNTMCDELNHIRTQVEENSNNPYLQLELSALTYSILSRLNVNQLCELDNNKALPLVEKLGQMSRILHNNAMVNSLYHTSKIRLHLKNNQISQAYDCAIFYVKENPNFSNSQVYLFAVYKQFMSFIDKFDFENALKVQNKHQEILRGVSKKSTPSEHLDSDTTKVLDTLKQQIATEEFTITIKLKRDNIVISNITNIIFNTLIAAGIKRLDGLAKNRLVLAREIHHLSNQVFPMLFQLAHSFPYKHNEPVVLFKEFFRQYEDFTMKNGFLAFFNKNNEILSSITSSKLVKNYLKNRYPERKDSIECAFEYAAPLAQVSYMVTSAGLGLQKIYQSEQKEVAYANVAPITALANAGIFFVYEKWYQHQYHGQLPESWIYYLAKEFFCDLMTLYYFREHNKNFQRKNNNADLNHGYLSRLSELSNDFATMSKVLTMFYRLYEDEFVSHEYKMILRNLTCLYEQKNYNELEKRLGGMTFLTDVYSAVDSLGINAIKIFNYVYQIDKLIKNQHHDVYLQSTDITKNRYGRLTIGDKNIPISELHNLPNILLTRLMCLLNLNLLNDQMIKNEVGSLFTYDCILSLFKSKNSLGDEVMFLIDLLKEILDHNKSVSKLFFECLSKIDWIKDPVNSGDSDNVIKLKCFFFTLELQCHIDNENIEEISRLTTLNVRNNICLVNAGDRNIPLYYFDDYFLIANLRMDSTVVPDNKVQKDEMDLIKDFQLERVNRILPQFKWVADEKSNNLQVFTMFEEKSEDAVLVETIKLNATLRSITTEDSKLMMPEAKLLSSSIIALSGLNHYALNFLKANKDKMLEFNSKLSAVPVSILREAKTDEIINLVNDITFLRNKNGEFNQQMASHVCKSSFGKAALKCLTLLHSTHDEAYPSIVRAGYRMFSTVPNLLDKNIFDNVMKNIFISESILSAFELLNRNHLLYRGTVNRIFESPGKAVALSEAIVIVYERYGLVVSNKNDEIISMAQALNSNNTNTHGMRSAASS